MLEVFGAPFDLCGARVGSRLGPDAIRLSGFAAAIGPYAEITDAGNFSWNLDGQKGPGIPYTNEILGPIKNLREKVRNILAKSSASRPVIPVMLGGEHSLTVGPISACLEAFGEDLAVIWIDAHGDVNTPATSPSGRIHGMPLGILSGAPSGKSGAVNDDWELLLNATGPTRLDLDSVAWIGLRDLDLGEREILKSKQAITMHDVDRLGMVQVWNNVDSWLRAKGFRNIYVSFDVDAFDPVLAPGTGTAVRGGLTYREGHLLAEMICESLHSAPYRLVGMDIMEVSPIHDMNNQTAIVATEWVASLLGKTIMGANG